ncbi:MAG: thioredoxin family protein [Bacteroidetes Order II. Incertae sedis bacterium]|nr:thioredoxin family protein [Bacteroidetes Order II. bacterium]
MKPLFSFFFLFWGVAFAQNNPSSPVILSPEKPLQTTLVVITYNPASPKATLQKVGQMELVEIHNGKPFEVYPMTLENGRWQVTLPAFQDQVYVVFGFRSGDKTDDNEGHWWDFLLYEPSGKPLRNALYMRAFSHAERNYDATTTNILKNKDLQAEVIAHPENLIAHTIRLKESLATEGQEKVMTEARRLAQTMWATTQNPIETFGGLSFLWRQLGKTEELTALKNKILRENPNGELAIRLKLSELLESRETSCDKINDFLQAHGEQVVPNDYRLYSVFNQYKNCKDRQKMFYWATKYAELSPEMASYANRTLASAFLESGFAPEAESFIQKAITAENTEIFRSYMKQDANRKWRPTSINGDKLALARADLKANNLKLAGKIYLALSKKETAYEALKTTGKILPDDKEVAMDFAQTAEALGLHQEAFDTYFVWAKKDQDNQEAFKGLARNHAQLKNNVANWKTIQTQLEDIWSKKPAPRFTVADYDPKRDPAKDLEATLAQARTEEKQVMLFVGGQWCTWCHALTRYFKQNEQVAQLLQDRYLIMKVNFSEENENTDFLSKYPPISGYPHLYFLAADGKLLHTQNTGEIEMGVGMAYDDRKVMDMLVKWSGK